VTSVLNIPKLGMNLFNFFKGCRLIQMSPELSETFNHKVRNINSVLLIYTDSGIYISQTFFENENFAFENSTAKQAVVYYW